MNIITQQNTQVQNFNNHKLQSTAVAERIARTLPAIDKQTKIFSRGNSQSTLVMMTLAMLNGQSPLRMMRQALSEIESRKMALVEAQLNLAKKEVKLEKINAKLKLDDSKLNRAKKIELTITINTLNTKAEGAMKDIAILMDAYEAIQKKNGITDWDESDFEQEEKKFHCRRGFELMYGNLLEVGRGKNATNEYLQEYGIHPQVAFAEVSGYVQHVEKLLQDGNPPDVNSLEDFLDSMTEKYYKEGEKSMMRIFGVTDISNENYMLLNK